MPTRNVNRYLDQNWGSSGDMAAARTRATELDRRNTQRIALETSVTYVSVDNQFSNGEGRLVDLSKEGCRIVGTRPVATGSILTLSIKLNDGHSPLCLCAKVCWIEGNRFGVNFAKLTDNERQRVQSLVCKFASRDDESEGHTGFRFA
jgi:hypothetical protein